MNVVYTIISQECEQLLAGFPLVRYPPAYHERLQRMKSTAARVRTQAGLDLLAHALQGRGRSETMITRVGFSAGGRPEIEAGPGFSISHSNTLVACAVADDQPGGHKRLVGLDVEARRSIVPARLVRLMNAREAAVVQAEPDRFFDFWCAREATVKASGRVGLARIRALALHEDHARLDQHDWPLQPLDLVPGYAACIASDRPIGSVRSERITITA